MNILAFDASTSRLCVALGKQERLLASFQSDEATRHSESLLFQIEKVTKKAGLKPQDIDVVAVGVGPGSFTGLRIAVSAGQAMAYTLKTRAVVFSSLKAIAYNVLDAQIVVALDAKRSQMYAAVYKRQGQEIHYVRKPAIIGTKDISRIAGQKALWVGSATPLFSESILSCAKGYRIADNAMNLPIAEGVYASALSEVKKRRFVAPEKIFPVYLHPKDCNVTLKK